MWISVDFLLQQIITIQICLAGCVFSWAWGLQEMVVITVFNACDWWPCVACVYQMCLSRTCASLTVVFHQVLGDRTGADRWREIDICQTDIIGWHIAQTDIFHIDFSLATMNYYLSQLVKNPIKTQISQLIFSNLQYYENILYNFLLSPVQLTMRWFQSLINCLQEDKLHSCSGTLV